MILPTYNRVEFLSTAIQSVLTQTFQNIELIVVDDGSEDGTAKLLRTVTDPRLKPLRQHNSGRSVARNRGVAASTGEYLAFLDDDDEFLPTKLQKQADFLDINPNVGLVAGGHELIDQTGNSLGFSEPWRRNPALKTENWLIGCPFLLQSIMIRRTWWDIVGGLDPELSQAHDHDFFLRLAANRCEMSWIHESVFRYRMHRGNVSRSALTQTQARIRMLEKYFLSDKGLTCSNTEKSQLFAYHWALGAMHAYAVGQISEAKHSLNQAILCDPCLASSKTDVLIGHAVEVANSPLNQLPPQEFVVMVFDNLPENYQYLRTLKRTALARLFMQRFFEGHARSDSKTVLAAFFPGVLREPNWLRNRGVWSIMIGAVLDSTISKPREEVRSPRAQDLILSGEAQERGDQ